MRLFVALELPPEVRQAAALVTAQLKKSGADVKWVASQNLHLTLKFLGEVPPEGLAGLKNALAQALAGQAALDLALEGCGAFPSPQRPQVVWLGLTGQVEALAGLAAAIEAACTSLGFAPEGRAFQAHLTLGRLRRGRGPSPSARPLAQALAGLSGYQGPEFLARQVALMESTLTPRGAIYKPLAVWELAKT
ncbi:MAG: RNA 2',3'-cyclic phosphodiesterase [Desulfarculus sp.]|nr:RNA 2',3'-cyclic phosphodiesterase [Desulfarculus sp.]